MNPHLEEKVSALSPFISKKNSCKQQKSSLRATIDCGAGPGVSFFALLKSDIKSLTLVEKDFDFVKLGKKLIPSSTFTVNWKNKSFLDYKEKAELILIFLLSIPKPLQKLDFRRRQRERHLPILNDLIFLIFKSFRIDEFRQLSPFIESA